MEPLVPVQSGMTQPNNQENEMNIYLYPADGVDVSSVAYLEEARRLLDAIDRKGKPLKFNDSRKKVKNENDKI